MSSLINNFFGVEKQKYSWLTNLSISLYLTSYDHPIFAIIDW